LLESVASEGGPGGWTCAVAPEPEEAERLTQLGVPRDFVLHALDLHERPRVQRSGDALLVVLRVPAEASTSQMPQGTIPFGLVLLPDRVVMICAARVPALERIRAFAEAEWSPSARHRLVLHALEVVAESFLEHVELIDEQVDRLEDELTRSTENREVIALLSYQKSLAHFTAALRGTELVIERLLEAAGEGLHIPEEDQPLLEDARIEFRQALEMTTLSSEILAQMMDAFASIISNNVNRVVKRLTAITFVLTCPVVIASFWGMNVPMPGARSSVALWALMAISAALSAGIALAFSRMRWL
jgi:magnesium transporter